MKILDPRSGNEVFIDYPRDLPAGANAPAGFTAAVRILQEGLDRPKPPIKVSRAPWHLFGSRISLDARASSALVTTTKRALALKVALAALCISGWSAFGYERWSFAAAERDRLTQIAVSEAEREQFRGELNELRHRTGDLRGCLSAANHGVGETRRGHGGPLDQSRSSCQPDRRVSSG